VRTWLLGTKVWQNVPARQRHGKADGKKQNESFGPGLRISANCWLDACLYTLLPGCSLRYSWMSPLRPCVAASLLLLTGLRAMHVQHHGQQIGDLAASWHSTAAGRHRSTGSRLSNAKSWADSCAFSHLSPWLLASRAAICLCALSSSPFVSWSSDLRRWERETWVGTTTGYISTTSAKREIPGVVLSKQQPSTSYHVAARDLTVCKPQVSGQVLQPGFVLLPHTPA
jgi:hypothetical protein